MSNQYKIVFRVEYRYECEIPDCRWNSIAEVKYKLTKVYEDISLTVELTDGAKKTLHLYFCSLIRINSIKGNLTEQLAHFFHLNT